MRLTRTLMIIGLHTSAICPSLYAIGRDDLKPSVDRPADGFDEDEADDIGEQPSTTTPTAPAAPGGKATTPGTAPAGTTPPAGEATVPAETAPVVRSALSKNLERKLFLGIGLGFGDIKASKGKWATRGNADLSLGYKVWQSKRMHLFTSYRYAPLSVVTRHQGQSYRGVIEGHYLGALLRFETKRTMSYYGQLELGPQVVRLKPTDSFKADKSLSKGGFAVALGGGADWEVLEKTLLGPRLNLGFGTFTTMQLALNAAVLF